MNLTYRGVSYQVNNLGYPASAGESIGVYRGSTVKLPAARNPLPMTGFAQLTYRGRKYYSPRYDISPLAATIIEP